VERITVRIAKNECFVYFFDYQGGVVGGSIMIVRRVDLLHTPKGFQDYVRDHFKAMELVGVPVYYASLRLEWNHEDHEAFRRGQMRGIAPEACRCDGRYSEGLLPNQRLSDWIRAHPEYATCLVVVGERECYYGDDD
jgi:hypothetical protein